MIILLSEPLLIVKYVVCTLEILFCPSIPPGLFVVSLMLTTSVFANPSVSANILLSFLIVCVSIVTFTWLNVFVELPV